ncbi:MAG: hypothetical protein KJZ59_09030, partial [Pararhodobacter sp.]|nr:hypothetical protein [Pararhodobacter sp.]
MPMAENSFADCDSTGCATKLMSMVENQPNLTWKQILKSFGKKISFWKQQRWPESSRFILTAYEIGERENYEK